jgi:membrane protein YqaA with SNARE-associated domain
VYLTAKTKPHHHLIPAWVLHLGLAGVFVVAFLDAAPVPLPIPGSTDILILVLGAHGENPWLLAPAAIAGSLIGAWFTWKAGKKGGEAMLERYVSKRLRSRMSRWIQSHGILTLCIAALLPPPIPLLPFLLAAGALGITWRQLFVALGIARTIRYAGWSSGILYTFLGLLGAAVLFGIWKYRQQQRHAGSPPRAERTSVAS